MWLCVQEEEWVFVSTSRLFHSLSFWSTISFFLLPTQWVFFPQSEWPKVPPVTAFKLQVQGFWVMHRFLYQIRCNSSWHGSQWTKRISYLPHPILLRGRGKNSNLNFPVRKGMKEKGVYCSHSFLTSAGILGDWPGVSYPDEDPILLSGKKSLCLLMLGIPKEFCILCS